MKTSLIPLFFSLLALPAFGSAPCTLSMDSLEEQGLAGKEKLVRTLQAKGFTIVPTNHPADYELTAHFGYLEKIGGSRLIMTLAFSNQKHRDFEVIKDYAVREWIFTGEKKALKDFGRLIPDCSAL